MAQIILPTGAVPATPTAGNVTVYAKTDGFIYGKDSAGVETPLSAVATASAITNTPAGNIAATTVQAAINELDSEKAATSGTLAQFAATTSAQLAGVISDETGSGALVFGTSPFLTTPSLGTATATSINKVALTAPATASTLTIADGKTFTSSNTLTLSGTDASTLNIGTGGTLGTAAYTASTAYAPAAGSTSIVTTGALNAGSITSGFGAIDIGADSLTAGTGGFTGVLSTGSNTGTGTLQINSASGGGNQISWQSAGATIWALGRNVGAGGAGELALYDYANAKTTAVFSSTGLAVTGTVTPEADNTRTLGTGALRWSVVYAGTGTINTSDAREKTAVRQLTSAEISASKQISQAIGAYQWLSSITEKGTAAREHIGLTVQRAIEILAANGLSPFNYGFICYDQWDTIAVEHPEVLAQSATYDAEGVELTPAVEYKSAWTETTRTAGDMYSFRMDELNLFVARGFEARLAALEAA